MDKTISENPIFNYLYHKAELIFFILDHDGYVIDANKYAKDFIGHDLISTKPHFYKIILNFDNLPSFCELIDNGAVSRIFNITKAGGLPQTYYFNFYEEKEFFFAFGQINHSEIEMLHENILTANKEINNLSRELHKSNAQLTKLNALKNQFLGMAAHDLRNPIGIILRYSEFLLEDTKALLSSESLEMLTRIRDSSKFMLHLLNDLLDISKIESGKLNLELRLTDFFSFVERNIMFNQVLAAKKQISLIFQGDKNLPNIMIDQSKIEQVLNNLISNAVKYSFPNTDVHISAVQSEENVVVSVQDEGQGIPENELSKLFQAFQTTSVKSTSSEKSTGLGLMIAKKIITEHKGKIWVESNVGKGSSFFFTIPIPEEEIKKIKIDYHEDKIIKNSTENNKIENCKPELSPYLDKTVIENLKGIDPDFLNELIAMFLEQSPKLMDNLRQAIKDKDSEKIIQIADQLRGASENLGALQLGGLYNDLISKEKNRDINDYTGFLNSIDRLYELTKKALQEV